MANPGEFDIAVVGMAGRFPGARDLDEFWQNVAGGVESIPRLSDEEILASGVPASYLAEPTYVKAAPVLDDPGCFDAGFFGFSPMEARTLDPQHRILLELAHEALENAGYDPHRYGGRIGVFTGSALNTYFMNVGLHRRLAEEYIPTLIGNDKDFLSTRLSYKLNLKGPSITVQTACSTSLVAVHLACQSLLSAETDMALAGAISVRVPHRAGYFCDGGGVVSPDGHVRAFDAKANGTVFGSGGGIVVLKRLSDALAEGDTIRAVIKGSAVNNDGTAKAGYTAPSVDSQADAVVEALANAGLEADSIGYIEAHGSGTPVGDPIEVRALTKAFRTLTKRRGFCAIGSVKTNVGHLDAAAAVAGLIKTVLAMEHRQLPPSLHFTEANPAIDFPATPFYVNTELRDWTSEGPRRAGVMSTGMGGTNAHVVLEEAPAPDPAASTTASPRRPHLLVLSAKTERALDQATDRLREFLRRNDAVSLRDVAYTLQVGRQAFAHRRYLMGTDRGDALAAPVASGRAADARRPIILLLPGLGDHYVGMAYDLYETWPVFREAVERCARILEPHLGVDIRSVIYPESRSWMRQARAKGIDLKQMLGRGLAAPEDPDARKLNQTLFAQPALFTIEYATARVWQALGITPDAIIGHSMGEYVAACLAGVLSLDDAVRLIAARAKLVDALPQGAMLAVTLPEEQLLPLLPEDLSISLINGPRLCVVAGPADSVARFEQTLEQRQVISRRVQNAHAFHSSMLEPIVPALEAEVRKVRLYEPTIRYISNVTGTWITPAEATNPAYWARHATRTARFSDALRELWRFENPILLEAGAGRTLGVLAMQHPARQTGVDPVPVSSIRHAYENQSDVEFLLHALGKLWLAGAQINWDAVPADGGGPRRRVPLPTYPFERQRYWIEAKPEPGPRPKQPGVDDWFYSPTWERTPFAREIRPESRPQDALWVIIADRYGGGRRLKAKLDELQLKADFVCFGEQLNPGNPDDYVKLVRALQGRAGSINIVHLGSVTSGVKGPVQSWCAANQNFGFYSLLYLARAIAELNVSVPIKIGIVSNRLHEVTGEERLDPEMATVLGPCGVIPKELPNVECFNIDLPDNQTVETLPDETLDALLAEFAERHENQVVAYRGRHRWERRYQNVRLSKRADMWRLRPSGVYLITGGTGGLGLTLARQLASACRPTLVLTKKTPFPDKPSWDGLLTAADTPTRVVKTIRALREIEQLGARVEVVIAESSDRAQMQAVIDGTMEKFGTIDGVLHAAGIVRAGLIQAKTKETVESVLAPKVYGTMILFDLLKQKANPDFLVLFSSITTVSTPYAEIDYAAANSFLDAFTYFANAEHGFRTLTINWPGWKEVGQLADLVTLPGVEGWKQAALERAIATEDGVEAFQRVLNSDLPQVVVSPESVDELLARSREPFDPALYLQSTGAARSERPTLRTSYDAPRDETEQQVARIWQDALGIGAVGINDNFAELGGHSLLAVRIVADLRKAFQIDLPLRALFDAPTVAELSRCIRERLIAEIDALTDEEAQRLVSQE